MDLAKYGRKRRLSYLFNMLKRAEAYWPLILLLALLKFVLPIFLQDSLYELQRDEFLYYQQGQHLALGYLENPPLLSYLGMISSGFGGSEAWIKFWPCLFGAATVVLTCLITAELGGKIFAQFLSSLGIITGAYLRIHYLFQPNILDIFFWTLAVYFLIRYVNTKDQKFIYWLAISLALGWWGKYSVIFMAAAMLGGIILSPYRQMLTRKHSWLAAGIGLLIVIPNLWWQYGHNWPLVHHMKELQETQLRFMNPLDFIKDQFMLLLTVVFIWIGGLIWLFKHKECRFLFYTYILVILLLILGRGKSYYSLGIYPLLLAAGAVAWEQWTEKRRWTRYALSLLILVLGYLVQPMLLPIWKPGKLAAFYTKIGFDHVWEDQEKHPLPQDFADMLGWKELAEKTEHYFNSLPDTVKNKTIIYGRHYGHAGSLNYYGKDKNFKSRVITDNGSFLLWIPENLMMEHLIFIGRKMPGKDDEVFQHFEKVTVIDSVTNHFSRQYGDKIIFFENIDSSGLRLARVGLRELQKKFLR